MHKAIEAGLMANAATLGIHWIYDHKFLKTLSKTESLLFRVQDHTLYRKAKPSYYSYPDHELGGVSVQGDILKWLYKALKDNPTYNIHQYESMLFKQFRPGGKYSGYVESYAKKQVINTLNKQLNRDIEKIDINDDHLVGFMPYLACKALDIDHEHAFELAKLYTKDKTYLAYYKMFDRLIDNLGKMDKKDAIKDALKEAPQAYIKSLEHAIEDEDTDQFIENYAGRACEIKQSVPVILHVFSHYDDFEEAMIENAKIGGAISDRNTILGFLLSYVSEVPKSWYNKLKIK